MKKIGMILLLAVLAVSVLPAKETSGTEAEAAVRDNHRGLGPNLVLTLDYAR